MSRHMARHAETCAHVLDAGKTKTERNRVGSTNKRKWKTFIRLEDRTTDFRLFSY